MSSASQSPTRRHALRLVGLMVAAFSGNGFAAQAGHPQAKWYQQALAMKHRAESWGDQGYGAVLVLDDELVGEGPSRVVKDGNSDAHAERVAIRDAQRHLGRSDLAGSVLYSTSRPCAVCEAAAARAGVARMYFGSTLEDAGSPRAIGVR